MIIWEQISKDVVAEENAFVIRSWQSHGQDDWRNLGGLTGNECYEWLFRSRGLVIYLWTRKPNPCTNERLETRTGLYAPF